MLVIFFTRYVIKPVLKSVTEYTFNAFNTLNNVYKNRIMKKSIDIIDIIPNCIYLSTAKIFTTATTTFV